jgi:hypothetical protein
MSDQYPTVNGYPIIAHYHTPARGCDAAGRIILVDRGPGTTDYCNYERYVVSWQKMTQQRTDGGDHLAEWCSSWSGGTYFVRLSDAAKYYEARVVIEQQRKE